LLTTTSRVDVTGWLREYVLSIDLNQSMLSTDLVMANYVAARAPLSTIAQQAGAVAAINGDFFDINTTGAPIGAAIRNGELLKTVQGDGSTWKYVGVGADRIARMLNLVVDASLSSPVLPGPQPITYINTSEVLQDKIGLYTPLWSDVPLSLSFPAAAQVRILTVQAGVVTAINTVPTAAQRAELPAPPADGFLIVAREQGATALEALQVGATVTASYAPTITPANNPRFVVGGNSVLVNNGVVPTDLNNTELGARSAIGFSADGRQLWLVTIDGRQSASHGVTLLELGQHLVSLGAFNALNLDGGGSATLAAREAGREAVTLVNRPSDGSERIIPNGIGLFVAPSSGRLHSILVAPLAPDPRNLRLFAGLARKLDLRGHDEHMAPAPIQVPQWQVLPAGSVDANQYLRSSVAPGHVSVQVREGSVVGTCTLQMLEALERIEIIPARLTLVSGDVADFRVVGFDQAGFSAPLEPIDVELTYDTSLLEIRSTSDRFEVQPKAASGASLMQVRVGSVSSSLPVTVGLEAASVSPLENTDGWVAANARAAATLTVAPGRQGNALKLSYDFTGTCAGCSTGTRAAYLRTTVAAPFLELPGQPVRIGVWVKSSDGRMPWLRLAIRHAANLGVDTVLNLTADYDENFGTDWRYVEAVVPAGLQYPLYLRQIYPVETLASRVYSGEVTFDDLTVQLAPTLEVPRQIARPDPVVVQSGVLEAERWRYAIVSDTHLYQSSTPNLEEQLTRRIFQQVRAAEPDFLIIAGDLIENGTAEEVTLAKRVLAEEFGETPPFPIYVIPGNHELRPQTTGSITDYVNGGFKTRFTFDHKNVRFVLLNTANALLHRPEFDQIQQLETALLDAEQNSAIQHVVVVGHHPTFDPLPPNSRTLNNSQDIALLDAWMQRFRERSGKNIMYHCGHAHYAHLRRNDGVLYVIGPAAGKVPYGEPDNGGFNGWVLYGVQPSIGDAGWLRAEVRVVLETVELDLPEQLQVGQTITVTAIGRQVRDRRIPLRYPVTAQWNISENATLGNAITASQSAESIARFDPSTGTLTALGPGSVTLQVNVNGVSAERSVVIVGQPALQRLLMPLITR
jgi:predicted phosphodiesterase